MLGHFSAKVEEYGSRNRIRGEYDAALYYTVVLGFPIYFSFRGCVHVMEIWSLTPGPRRDRLCWFAQRFLGDPDLSRSVYLPLRPMRSLKRLVLLDYTLWTSATFGVVLAPIVTFALLRHPPVPMMKPVVLPFLCLLWGIAVFFVVLLFMHLRRRRPSPRQRQIRSVVADALGPFSDPADWELDVVSRVAEWYHLTSFRADATLYCVDAHFARGRYVEALVVARLGLSLADASCDDELEEFTDKCLMHLGRRDWTSDEWL